MCVCGGGGLWIDTDLHTYSRVNLCLSCVCALTSNLYIFKASGAKVAADLVPKSEPQLVLLGFRPIEALKPYLNMKNPTFLEPSEQAAGSLSAMHALVDSMVAKRCAFGMCCRGKVPLYYHQFGKNSYTASAPGEARTRMPSLAARYLEKKIRRCFDFFSRPPPPFLFSRVHPRLTR